MQGLHTLDLLRRCVKVPSARAHTASGLGRAEETAHTSVSLGLFCPAETAYIPCPKNAAYDKLQQGIKLVGGKAGATGELSCLLQVRTWLFRLRRRSAGGAGAEGAETPLLPCSAAAHVLCLGAMQVQLRSCLSAWATDRLVLVHATDMLPVLSASGSSNSRCALTGR